MRRSARSLPRRVARRLVSGLLGASVLALLALPAVASAAEGGSDSSFCKRRLAVDYSAPLVAMPGARPLPEGELPFGPRNFSVYTIGHIIGRPHVAMVGTSVGYEFAGKNDNYRALDLGWRFQATAWAVAGDGRVLHKIGIRGWHVTRIKELSKLKVGFPAAHPGYVRVDVRISTLTGKTLGTYRDYFRVLKPTDDVRLAVEDRSVRPGERAVGLVENHGAAELREVSSVLEVEHLEAGTWTAVPQPPTKESISEGSGWWLAPGENARCYGYTVPADAPPGQYRFTGSAMVLGLKTDQVLIGRFQVTS